MKHAVRNMAALSIAAFALSIAARSAFAARPPDSATIPGVLEEVKYHAAEANYDAEVMESYTRSNISWQLYAGILTEIKEHANDLFKDYRRLLELRDSGTPAQQEVIDRLEPQVLDMATELTNTIQILHEEQIRVSMPKFRGQAQASSAKVREVYKSLCQCTGKNARI